MIGYGFSDVCFQNGIFSVSCILHFFCGFVQTGKECIWSVSYTHLAYSRTHILEGGHKTVEYTDDEFDAELDKDMDAGENPATRLSLIHI